MTKKISINIKVNFPQGKASEEVFIDKLIVFLFQVRKPRHPAGTWLLGIEMEGKLSQKSLNQDVRFLFVDIC